jgi:chromosome segregation protein
MKLDFIELSGFRGFREPIRIQFGSAFTVICGRNGVGKSTLCDAVEFALTGEIDKYRVEKAAKESASDYFWWRGEAPAPAYYVRLGFRDVSGLATVVSRSREQGADTTDAKLMQLFCQGDAVPDDALRQMIRTSLIRDEWIAELSLDLTDTERFEVVRAALGSVGGPNYPQKAKDVDGLVENSLGRATSTYDRAREQLNDALTRLAQLRETTARAGDIAAALATLESAVSSASADATLAAKLSAARALLANDRKKLAAYADALRQLRELIAYRQQIDAGSLGTRRETAEKARSAAQAELDRAAQAREQAQRLLDAERTADTMAAELAALIAHGEHLGLHSGECPLCAAPRTPGEFADGLAKARLRLTELGSRALEASEALAKAEATVISATTAVNGANDDLLALQNQLDSLREREQAHIELFDRFQLDHAVANDAAALENRIATERERLLAFERAILTLDASIAVQQIQSLDDRVAALRSEVNSAADALARMQNASAQAKALERGVKRAAGELVDERLALISPLLNELYHRLRPHAEWKNIEYAVRGEVRRFLSLRVGNNLNPQFVFSSGQRRTAGLAFLLSVHLARSWCRWKTLLLDDPVQHIDDYRALNLVEILAALRGSGRQIVCAVEDRALADLLCRRLAGDEADGTRIDLEQTATGVNVGQTVVPPLPASVLRRTAPQRVAG